MQRETNSAAPALVILFGSRGRSVWPLERAVTTLGRAQGCDICLDAPDVSSLHCIITCDPQGLRLRDCRSRAGTLLNGVPAHETTVHDGDVLQLGSFSFRVYVPASLTRDRGQEARLRRVERSRHNLVRLALALRKRLQIAPPPLAADAATTDLVELADLTDLNRKASNLRHCFQAYQQRLRKLEEKERELARDRELFEDEKLAQHELLRQAEAEMAERASGLRQPSRGFGLFRQHRQLEIMP